MKYDGFNYSFTPKELWFLLFGKKVCPRCGNVLVKHKGFRELMGRDLNEGSGDPFFVPQSRIKDYEYTFYCDRCDASFFLSDLR